MNKLWSCYSRHRYSFLDILRTLFRSEINILFVAPMYEIEHSCNKKIDSKHMHFDPDVVR